MPALVPKKLTEKVLDAGREDMRPFLDLVPGILGLRFSRPPGFLSLLTGVFGSFNHRIPDAFCRFFYPLADFLGAGLDLLGGRVDFCAVCRHGRTGRERQEHQQGQEQKACMENVHHRILSPLPCTGDSGIIAFLPYPHKAEHRLDGLTLLCPAR